MTRLFVRSLLPCAALVTILPLAGRAQMHAVSKPEDVIRAVAVYEWTGDEAKPTASRIIPVSIFINGQLRDADIYLARPVPLALDTGNLFEVEHAGEPQGTLEIAFARSLSTTGDQDNDNTWFGYGFFKATPKPTEVAAKQSGPLSKVVVLGGNGPHFGSQPASAAPSAEKPAPPVDRSGAASGTVSADPADKTDVDPDSAKDNPDRPTLRRRSPEERKAAQKKAQQAAVIGVGTLTDDPDRPILHRGREKTPEEELTPLLGLPADMHQAVAVSDPKDRSDHNFHLEWDSAEQRAQVLKEMQAFARVRLGDYAAHLLPATLAPVAGAEKAAAPAHTAHSAKSSARAHHAAHREAVAPAPVPLNGEFLRAYELSYGGDPTYVYSAETPGQGGATEYVTVVAQRQPTGELKVALTSATDSLHLDRTPRMLLVDAVDARASNRASLLFELRAQQTRQFALYRVLGAESEQTFATDSIPSGAAARGTTLLHHSDR